MFTVDAVLQHTCAEINEQADRGQLSAVERDLLVDGAILLAVHLDALARDGRVGMPGAWHQASAASAGRHAASPDGRVTLSECLSVGS